jgi:hypothetical protein
VTLIVLNFLKKRREKVWLLKSCTALEVQFKNPILFFISINGIQVYLLFIYHRLL